MSHSTMTKFYKGNKKQADAFDAYLAKQFPDQWFDCTQFFTDRYPQGMLDPKQRPDTIHWSNDTYVELFNRVITAIQKNHTGGEIV